MNWQLKYLDENNQHLDVNSFDNLSDAMDEADLAHWSHSFEIHGMHQHMKGTRDNNTISWCGM
jgi:hypothetical protein